MPLSLSGNDSAETLIGHEEIDSEPSYEKVEHVPSNVGNRETPPVAEIISDEVQMQDSFKAVSAPAELTAPDEAQHTASAEDDDVKMNGVDEEESVDKKVLNALEHQTRSSGTDQQDVEEVIGSIINRLQAAIQPSKIDEKTGIQLEKIMETFFVTTVNYTKKFDDKEYQHEISFDRSITAFPAPDGPCSLYDALGRNFDQQILEESKLSRYTAIKTLPPVLHVLIQRSQSIGRKNGNPVVIPETLYLDRYMDAPHDSPAFRRRVEDWSIATRVEEIKAQKAKIDTTVSTAGILEPIRLGTFAATDQATAGKETKSSVFENETWDFDGPVDDDFMLVNPVPQPESAEDLLNPLPQEAMHATEKAIQEMMEAELQQREKTLEEHQEASKDIPYRLHAVICHRGHLSSGHYWVWIRDFEDDLWRWYNDADVKENKNTEDVLKTLSSSGEPYYLCYVRDSDKEKYVDVPKRQRPEGVDTAEEAAPVQDESHQMPDAPPSHKEKDADGDVAVQMGSSSSGDWGVPQQPVAESRSGDQSVPEPPPYSDW
jgi:ubiquitin carboxyl-terminal hydrolase 25/28